MREVLAKSGLGLGQLRKMEEDELTRLKEFVEEARKKYGGRDPQFDNRLREDLAHSMYLSSFGGSQAQLIGADVFAADAETLAAYGGKTGNPSVWLYDASKQWKGKVTNRGPGCVGGVSYHPTGTIWWYTWFPPETRTYWIFGRMLYHGYYSLYSYAGWPFFCGEAGVFSDADRSVHSTLAASQYPQLGIPPIWIEHDDIISESGSFISSKGALDGATLWSFNVKLHKADTVYFAVTLSMQALAKGPLSYAELNFQDGQANYVNPPLIFVTPA